MFNDSSGLPAEVVDAVLSRYALRAEGPVEPAGGTAAPKVRFHVDGKPYLLRRRRAEFCPEPVVRFDHSVIRRLARAGLPVIEPLANRDGVTWVILDEATYEIYPFIKGLSIMDQRSPAQVADAGRQLARFHRATDGFTPEGHKYWPREFHMARNCKTLVDFLATPAAQGPLRPVADRLMTACNRVAEALPDEAVDALPHCIIHGDYTWANVMYRGESVAGIFDFDWTDRQARMHDLARGLIWFGTLRSGPLDPDSIWHLVQGWAGDEQRTRAFMDAYAEHVELTEAERHLLPAMTAETWFCCRIRAMRKVTDDEKLKILAADLAPTLDFFDTAPWPWRLS